MALSEAFLTWEREKDMQSKQEERQAIALNLLKENIPLETIARTTGLTIPQVQALQAVGS
jgi:predicted Rossmann fold nucleotide-binding protein DprA/Smf involved in DNA uptake